MKKFVVKEKDLSISFSVRTPGGPKGVAHKDGKGEMKYQFRELEIL